MKTEHSKYTAKTSNGGIIKYTEEENETWFELIKTQMKLLPNRACEEFLEGLNKLNLPMERIPQLKEINKILTKTTGWQVTAVPALISFDRFFKLLANQEFPVATFIRTKDEFEYLQEPDIFHEILGHCPLLTNPDFAAFTHSYGKIAYKASKEDRRFLARLYWLTVEFGLIETSKGMRIYGGGILSSPKETVYSVESAIPQRISFEMLDVLRTPYKIDILQPIYYYIKNMNVLNKLSKLDLIDFVQQAKQLKLKEPLYAV